MDRRAFLRHGLRKVGETAGQVAGARAAMRPVNWIRPPFAVPEDEFLMLCDRCGKCADACPHDVVFELSASLGSDIAGTPALDLLNRGCRMCADWPCVSACAPDALRIPVTDDDMADEAAPSQVANRLPLPKLASATLDETLCLPYLGPECGACADSCPVPGALTWDRGTKPSIHADHCSGCGMCREVCVVEPKAIRLGPLGRRGETT